MCKFIDKKNLHIIAMLDLFEEDLTGSYLLIEDKVYKITEIGRNELYDCRCLWLNLDKALDIKDLRIVNREDPYKINMEDKDELVTVDLRGCDRFSGEWEWTYEIVHPMEFVDANRS